MVKINLTTFGTVVALLAGLIATYKFLIKRPRVRLVAENGGARGYGFGLVNGRVHDRIKFAIENVGFRYAENVYVRLQLEDWNFGEPRRKIEWRFEVSANEETDSQESMENEDADKEDAKEENDSESDDNIRIVDSVLEMRHDIETYFLSSGENNHILIDDILYNGESFHIFSGKVELEQFRTYEVIYSVGCQNFGPRRGKILLYSGYDEIKIEHQHPRFWTAWFDLVKQALFQLLTFLRSKLERLLKTNLSLSDARLVRSKSIYKEHDGNRTFLPYAQILIRPYVQTPRSIRAKATLIYEDANKEGIIGTVTFFAYSLLGGEFWEPSVPRNQSRRNLIQHQTEYGGYRNALPLILEEQDSEINVKWEIDSWEPRRGDLSGLEVEKCELKNVATASLPRAVGEVTNRNTVDVTLFAIAKFHDGRGNILITPYKEFTIKAEGKKEVTIDTKLMSEEKRDRIEGCDMILSSAL